MALYGHWALDEHPAVNATNFTDSGTGANDGTFFTGEGGTDKSVSGHIGTAVQLDGSNDSITIANESNFDFNTQSFTVAGWVKNVTGVGIFAAKGGANLAGGWMFVLSDTGMEVVTKKSDNTTCIDQSATGSQPFNDGNWHHVCAVIAFDTVTIGNNSVALYVDGLLIASSNGGSGSLPSLNNHAVTFGCRLNNEDSPDLFLPAKIDDLRIYNVGLSAGEIAVLGEAPTETDAELRPDHRLMAVP